MKHRLGQYEASLTGPGYPYGILSFNTYPGFSFGQRLISGDEAVRIAKERWAFEKQRAETTDLPEFKYLTPDGLGDWHGLSRPLSVITIAVILIWIFNRV